MKKSGMHSSKMSSNISTKATSKPVSMYGKGGMAKSGSSCGKGYAEGGVVVRGKGAVSKPLKCKVY